MGISASDFTFVVIKNYPIMNIPVLVMMMIMIIIFVVVVG
jgi:hypothetical protein